MSRDICLDSSFLLYRWSESFILSRLRFCSYLYWYRWWSCFCSPGWTGTHFWLGASILWYMPFPIPKCPYTQPRFTRSRFPALCSWRPFSTGANIRRGIRPKSKKWQPKQEPGFSSVSYWDFLFYMRFLPEWDRNIYFWIIVYRFLESFLPSFACCVSGNIFSCLCYAMWYP